jgi:hypothetical protein
MPIKIPTPTFLEIQSELADWLMNCELGDDAMQSTMIETVDNELHYTEEGQEIFNDYYDDVEAFLLNYFEKEND